MISRQSDSRPFRLAAILPRLAEKFLRYGAPSRTLLFGPLSVGDDLLCTTVLHEARKRGLPFSMMTNRPEIFSNNPDPEKLIPVDDYYAMALRKLGRTVVQPYYAAEDPEEPDRDVYAPGHVLARMCRMSGLAGEISLRPYFHLSEKERIAGRHAPRQIAFQSSGAGAALPYANKEWIPSRFAAVAAGISRDFKAVQLGSPSDPPLPGTLDLRGRTTLREAAAVLASSEAFVGLEGFLSHLARAVDCPAVIVLGGRVRLETFGYACNEYLAAPMPCAPCGLRNRCAFDRGCLQGVAADEALAALRRLLGRPRVELEVARVRLDPEGP